MKTKLLSLTLALVLFSSITNAQTKVWDFGNDHTTWPLSSGTGVSETAIDNLGLFANSSTATSPITNFAAITSSNATFPDTYMGTTRLQLNGAGFAGGVFSAMPTQRFVYFNVTGSCTVKVWFKTGSNGATRTVYVTNGTATLGSATTNSGSNGDFGIITATYTGGADQLYVYADAASNLYKIEVTGTTVVSPVAGINDFQSGSAVKVYANGKQISVADVTSATQVDVYTITGALVKSVKTEANTTIELMTSGVYIVNVKSAEGQKSVKVLIK
jgi:hypothetical protein